MLKLTYNEIATIKSLYFTPVEVRALEYKRKTRSRPISNLLRMLDGLSNYVSNSKFINVTDKYIKD